MIYFRKQPWDQITKGFDKTGKLPSGTTIASATVSAINLATALDSSSDVLGSTDATIESGVRMKVLCKGGTSGDDHKITFRAILSSGERFEEEMTMMVREL